MHCNQGDRAIALSDTSSGVPLCGISYPLWYTSLNATAFKQMTPTMIWLNSRIIDPDFFPNRCRQHLSNLFDMTVTRSGPSNFFGIVEWGLIPHSIRFATEAFLKA